ncbi:MAG: class IV adenylate cyclase [Candidatus Promineifilaceae bacterium]|jgi:adenylate cyclase class 2
MPAKKNLEVEVKFLVEDLESLKEQLLEAGAILVRPRVYERNVRFDTALNALLKEEKLLRLRQDTAVILTFKAPSEFDQESEAKIRQEIEVRVDDFDRMAMILDQLGFEPKQTYEKYREAYHLNDLEIVLDEMPYGLFVELEGDEQTIKETAERLNLVWGERILSNYLAMMGILVDHYHLPFQDVTFENFRDIEISFKEVLPLADDPA